MWGEWKKNIIKNYLNFLEMDIYYFKKYAPSQIHAGICKKYYNFSV